MRTRMAGAAVAAFALVAAAGAATPKWNLLPAVPLPAGAGSSQLQAVTVVSPHDVWSAGAWWDKTDVHPLMTHWDGAAWTAADLPALPRNTYLGGVDALDAKDVWAVSSVLGNTVASTPSLLHYDGSSWQTAPAPAFPAATANDLDGLDMRTADDGWAVGETSTATLPAPTAQPLILRWQGGKWSGSPVPKSAAPGGLVAVAAASADDVWAVGTQAGLASSTRLTHGLVMHFDGTAWSTVDLPAPLGTSLNAVAVAGPGDVWAAGEICGAGCRGAVWHLTTAGWQQVPTNGGTDLLALVAPAPDDVWALGYQQLAGNAKGDHVEHWDGKQFTTEDTGLPPMTGTIGNNGELGSATPIFAADNDPAGGELWAVGWSNPPSISPRVIHRG
ncbi:hypothetical protein [Actinoplanes sp. NPDC051411]|uniref:hypothetical protein n=1 Tax=Actinoplanes sp. NPDC051411 TaxID=3155522 RepID=UPI00344A5103